MLFKICCPLKISIVDHFRWFSIFFSLNIDFFEKKKIDFVTNWLCVTPSARETRKTREKKNTQINWRSSALNALRHVCILRKPHHRRIVTLYQYITELCLIYILTTVELFCADFFFTSVFDFVIYLAFIRRDSTRRTDSIKSRFIRLL